ncbi:hypothetical protein SAY87_019486 [Trapa incisa]|uniref:Uncharacterized protein n=1 Tax=Trapa incisa TaxID=236973 RepID=A0AAN7K7P2_9MYRT|nr:hypothetical protein SAY87_019486 [Trapa incisa]
MSSCFESKWKAFTRIFSRLACGGACLAPIRSSRAGIRRSLTRALGSTSPAIKIIGHSVDLGNSNLSGHLVPELGKLEHLQYLKPLIVSCMVHPAIEAFAWGLGLLRKECR